ncbi:MAG TPA: YCF48-related protein [Azospirillum sp.]|nr:YCF48-related protein [Azospirillum sp.]
MMKTLSLAVILPVALLAGASVAHAAADPLDRPAVASALAPRSLLTAVTHAGERIVAVGERGHILLSDDAGVSWRQVRVPTSVTLTSVRFADARLGWAVGHGGVILRTVDGGATWTKQLDGRAAAQLVLDATPKGDVQAVAEAERLVRDGPDKPFFDLLVKNGREVLAIGAYGLIFETLDGGASWQPVLDRVPNPERKHLYAIRADGDAVYLAGEQGLLLRSNDGGRRFTVLDSPYVGSFFGLVVAPGGALLALGLRGNLYRSADGGAAWTKLELPTQSSFTGAVALGDGSVVLLDEAGTVWLSRDRGMAFDRQPQGRAFPFLDAVELAGGGLLAVGARGTATLSLAPAK